MVAMVGKTAPIKRQDELRFQVITTHIGCLCCAIEMHDNPWEDIALTTIEHVTENGRRLPNEHQATIGLCPWHHQGAPWRGLQAKEMDTILGPSLANGRKPFEEHYGDEVDVLLPVQDEAIILFAQNPWPEYSMPASIRKQIRAKWNQLRNHRELSPCTTRSESS
jgi:hypothetical protein